MMLLGLTSKLSQQRKELSGKKMFSMFGHDFHFLEIVLFLSLGYSIGMTVLCALGFTFPTMWTLNVPLVSVSGVSAGYTWNLYTTKRLGRMSTKFEVLIHQLGLENNKLRQTNETIMANNEDFENKLELLEDARVTLGRSVLQLEKVVEKQHEITAETEEIMEKRRDFHEKLKEFIASENLQSAKAAEITLNERIFALFDMYSVDGKIGFDYECLAAFEESLADLQVRDLRNRLKDLDVLTKEEFSRLMETIIAEALVELNEAMLRIREVRREIVIKDKEIYRLQEQINKEALEQVEEKLSDIHHQTNV